jgi:hypothetical protein
MPDQSTHTIKMVIIEDQIWKRAFFSKMDFQNGPFGKRLTP